MAERRFDVVLGVVTHVPHWAGDDGRAYAYEPYVRELDLWGKLFGAVEVLAPRAEGPMRGNQAPYEASNVRWRPVEYRMTVGAGAPLARLSQLPGLLSATARLLRQSDLVLLRSPGHPALFGRVLAGLLGKRTITKWAGLFDAFEGERLPSRVERQLVKHGHGPTLIYGPTDRPHLIPFIPALMSTDELEQARALAAGRSWTPPWRILSVGRLTGVKGFDLALRGLARLREAAPDLPWRYTLVGDGPQADELRELARGLGMADRVDFPGALSFRSVQDEYARAHVVIMPGVMEGYPKTIAEAWAHGAVPVAAAAGIVPWIMEGKDAGVLFDPDPDSLSSALRGLLADVDGLREMSRRGNEQCAELSLEAFRARLAEILVERCGLQ